MKHTCNSSVWEVEAGGVQGRLLRHCHMRPCLNQTKPNHSTTQRHCPLQWIGWKAAACFVTTDVVAGGPALHGKEDIELLCRVTSLSLLLGTSYCLLTMCERDEGSLTSPALCLGSQWVGSTNPESARLSQCPLSSADLSVLFPLHSDTCWEMPLPELGYMLP